MEVAQRAARPEHGPTHALENRLRSAERSATARRRNQGGRVERYVPSPSPSLRDRSSLLLAISWPVTAARCFCLRCAILFPLSVAVVIAPPEQMPLNSIKCRSLGSIGEELDNSQSCFKGRNKLFFWGILSTSKNSKCHM